MPERHFYDEKYNFEGSMDDDGIIYDERHRIIGRLKGDTIYDSTNIPKGYIGDDGMVQNLSHIPVGMEYGTAFRRWTEHQYGHVREDVFGEAHGTDYGIFSMVKDNNRFGDGNDDHSDYGYDDEEERYESGLDDDGRNDFNSRPRRSSRHRRRKNNYSDGDNVEGCCKGCGCVVAIILAIYILGALIGS